MISAIRDYVMALACLGITVHCRVTELELAEADFGTRVAAEIIKVSSAPNDSSADVWQSPRAATRSASVLAEGRRRTRSNRDQRRKLDHSRQRVR